MEVRKAAHPGTYIPYVVRAGSDQSWNRHLGDGGEYLDRYSAQRLWLNPQRYELILERAFLNRGEQKITFLGVPELTGPGGTRLLAGAGQPLFHVEHAVGGTEQQPLNRWRIVHLTDARDERLIAVFERMTASPWLAEHTEIYIRDTLGIQLSRKPAQGLKRRHGPGVQEAPKLDRRDPKGMTSTLKPSWQAQLDRAKLMFLPSNSVRLNWTASAAPAAGAGALRHLRRRACPQAQESKERGGGWRAKREEASFWVSLIALKVTPNRQLPHVVRVGDAVWSGLPDRTSGVKSDARAGYRWNGVYRLPLGGGAGESWAPNPGPGEVGGEGPRRAWPFGPRGGGDRPWRCGRSRRGRTRAGGVRRGATRRLGVLARRPQGR